MALMLRVEKSPSPECALTNLVYVHPLDAAKLEATAVRESAVVNNNVMGLPGRNYVMIKSLVFNYAISKTTPPVEQGCICLSPWQRQQLLLALGDSVAVAPYVPTDPFVHAWHLSLEVDWMAARKDYPPVDASQLKDLVTNSLLKQFVSREQTIGLHFEPAGANVKFKVANIRAVDWATLTSPMSPSPPKKSELLTPSTTTASPARVETVNPDGSKILGVEVGRAILSRCTIIEIKRAATSTMKVTDSSSTTPGNRIEFKRNILDACALGIGGLEREFNEIFRRAFVPRLFGSHFMTKSLGQKHVKGIILYGPPGTGKTLIARQIGKMFNGKEPIVKSGPEMLNKYVGKSEENIRELFAEAEADFERNGDDAELHVIVIDELDSICRARGSGATGGTNVGDSIVNQLLAKLDGVNQLNNILLIGMTNRLDLIDEALTRPGRLEVKIEIGLPDEPGRLQILRIHTGLMKSEGYLSPDVDLNDLAKRTKNWSGAELEGIVRNACTYAMDEHVDPQNLSAPLDPRTVAVKKDHFEASMKQIKPAFGVAEDEFERCAPNGIIDYGPACRAVLETGKLLVEQLVEENTQTPLISLLLRGSAGSGKTALATQIARNSGFSYIKLLSAENQAGYPESIKCARIHKVFEDSYRTPFSVIVIDDFERLIEYTSIGPRFSNTLLQLLLVLVRKQPPQGRRLLVVGTITTSGGVMDDLGAMLHDAWDAVVDVPCVTGPGELAAALLALRPDLTPDMRDAVCGGCGGGCQVPMKKLIHECGRAKRLSASGAVGPVEAMCERLTPFRAAAATTSPASTTTNTPPAQEDRKL